MLRLAAGLLALLVVALLGAAPAPSQSPAPRPPDFRGDDPDPSIADGSAQRRLNAARRRWRRLGSHNYRFRLSRSCFCPQRGPFVVFVRNDRPVNAPPDFRDVATIRRLQRAVQRAIDDEVAGLSVRYDRRGIPRSIFIDGHRMLADDEVGYRVDRFWRGTRGRGGPDTPLPPDPGPIPQ